MVQQYIKAEISLSRALLKLPLNGIPEDVKEELEKFACLKYCPKCVSIDSGTRSVEMVLVLQATS